jgi:hypothetical protein
LLLWRWLTRQRPKTQRAISRASLREKQGSNQNRKNQKASVAAPGGFSQWANQKQQALRKAASQVSRFDRFIKASPATKSRGEAMLQAIG